MLFPSATDAYARQCTFKAWQKKKNAEKFKDFKSLKIKSPFATWCFLRLREEMPLRYIHNEDS